MKTKGIIEKLKSAPSHTVLGNYMMEVRTSWLHISAKTLRKAERTAAKRSAELSK
jgi:hypothetical protein